MGLQAAYADIRAEGAELVALSVDTVAEAERMAEHAQAEFPVLADPTMDTTSRYGLFNLLGDGVSAPATLIIDRDRRVVAANIGENIGDRVPPEAILRVLRELRGDGA